MRSMIWIILFYLCHLLKTIYQIAFNFELEYDYLYNIFFYNIEFYSVLILVVWLIFSFELEFDYLYYIFFYNIEFYSVLISVVWLIDFLPGYWH